MFALTHLFQLLFITFPYLKASPISMWNLHLLCAPAFP